jgi:hypothetical protein
MLRLVPEEEGGGDVKYQGEYDNYDDYDILVSMRVA